MTPKLDRVIETCLYVDDLDRAARFYERVLGLAALTADARFRAYDVGGKSVLLLFRRGATLETVRMPGGTIPPHDGRGPLHMAFAIAADALPHWVERLRRTASISATRTDTCWSLRRRACGRFTEGRRSRDEMLANSARSFGRLDPAFTSANSLLF